MSVLEVRDLQKRFYLGGTQRMVGKSTPPLTVHAVEGVSFDVDRGEILTIVGESGCGKSTIAKTLVGLTPASGGTMRVSGRELGPVRTQADCRLIQLVSQNPWSAMNRRRTLQHALEQPLKAHGIGDSGAERERMIAEMIERVGLSQGHLKQRPSGVSGGELARAVLARALLLSPEVIILDEPTASLDVSVKATVVNLLLDLRAELGLSMVLITHEIDIARKLADQAAVMYLGRFVETGAASDVLGRPQHPYARMLLNSVPVADPRVKHLSRSSGDVPSAVAPPSGCAYHPRCSHFTEICSAKLPLLEPFEQRLVACHHKFDLGASDLPEPEFVVPGDQMHDFEDELGGPELSYPRSDELSDDLLP